MNVAERILKRLVDARDEGKGVKLTASEIRALLADREVASFVGEKLSRGILAGMMECMVDPTDPEPAADEPAAE